MTTEVLERGWLKEQIEKAKKDVDEWPRWMKEASKKEATNGNTIVDKTK